MESLKYTFILVDDSDIDLLINKRFLELSDMCKNVHSFLEPRALLDFLHQESTQLKDVVFLIDLQIPDMNGFELVQEIEKLSPALVAKSKLFILSSSIDLEDKLNASNSQHIAAMLPKPLNIQLLKAKLESVLTK